MNNGTDLWVAAHRARLTLTDLARLAEVSRPTIYTWIHDTTGLPLKGSLLVEAISVAVNAGRLPLRDKPSPAERPKMTRLAVYGA